MQQTRTTFGLSGKLLEYCRKESQHRINKNTHLSTGTHSTHTHGTHAHPWDDAARRRSNEDTGRIQSDAYYIFWNGANSIP